MHAPCVLPPNPTLRRCCVAIVQASLSKPIGVYEECEEVAGNSFASFVLFGVVANTSDDLLRANGLALFSSFYYAASARAKSGV